MPVNRQRRRKNLRLISLRVNEGLSREALAYRAGISRETVRLAEEGWTPLPRTQFALAEVFKAEDGRKLRPLDIWPLEQQPAVVR
jgi:DNA-binding XRE family transcriptional regulator